MTAERGKCQECGGETENDYRACMGACASERLQGDDQVDLDTKGLISCNCCEKCRLECYESFMELADEEGRDTEEGKEGMAENGTEHAKEGQEEG